MQNKVKEQDTYFWNLLYSKRSKKVIFRKVKPKTPPKSIDFFDAPIEKDLTLKNN